LQTVARPVLEALHPLRRSVELEVLRPPTFDELVKRLHQNKGYYHVVHFDGHGIFGREPSAQRGSGYLLFEEKGGGGHPVSSEELGQELATCRVPLFVLNACQSAREGRDPYSSVASQLVASGAEGVVAMSYSVYSTAAAKFMHQFYEALIDQKLLSEAVASGRRMLYADPYRDSVVGPLKLQDWMIPVLYQKEYGYTPIETVEERDISDAERVILSAQKVCPEGQFGFVGRDYDLLQIERALYESDHPWIVINGMGGCGKTALAYGFARWFEGFLEQVAAFVISVGMTDSLDVFLMVTFLNAKGEEICGSVSFSNGDRYSWKKVDGVYYVLIDGEWVPVEDPYWKPGDELPPESES